MHNQNLHEIHVTIEHADPLLAMGLASALSQDGRIRVHAAAPDAQPVAVTIAGYSAALRLAAAQRTAPTGRPRILAVAREEREQEVRQALEAGVHGYLLQDCRVDELLAGVRALSEGRRYLCQAAAQRVAESMLHEALTLRESEVLELLANGHGNKAIARQLDIAVGTVKAHVKGIMNKLDVSSRTQAVSVAVARGMVGALGTDANPPRLAGLAMANQ